MPQTQVTTPTLPKSNAMRLVKRNKSYELIERLITTICLGGHDPQRKAEALLLLLDEIERADPDDVRTITLSGKRMAFVRIAEESSELMNAQIQLLRSEF